MSDANIARLSVAKETCDPSSQISDVCLNHTLW